MNHAETDKGNFRLVPRACGGGSAPADVRQPLEAFPLFRRLFGVELEKVGDAVQVGAGRRKAVCLVNERSYALNGLTIFIPQ